MFLQFAKSDGVERLVWELLRNITGMLTSKLIDEIIVCSIAAVPATPNTADVEEEKKKKSNQIISKWLLPLTDEHLFVGWVLVFVCRRRGKKKKKREEKEV